MVTLDQGWGAYVLSRYAWLVHYRGNIGVRGGGSGWAARSPGLKNFQGKLCFQGKC